ncbi:MULTISPECIES: hypothetical protein [unclassified Streptomyces]|uniref:hypothetical protein n=1 Tax=unclassified Streptomyces TaxID=2593676 RepID=UPI001F28AB14|nr:MULTISPECIES: hypothetical protein [unclassified Streptomyces]MCF0087171.1 hypothetical protein [Streptomyces sp. MH192]MCF0098991.1 hypothetical protein [Streptomyces sp. MH191]
MRDAARQLGGDLAALEKGTTTPYVSAQVVDVTDTGVNLMMSGTLFVDVPCLGSYRSRKAGDWVIVRPGARPVVMGRPEDDPGAVDETRIRELATEVALDEQVIREATWGTGGPSGSGWQQATTLFVRKDVNGKVELYAQVASPTDTPPPAKPGATPSPVTVTANSSGSWRNGRPDDYADYPMQGDWTGGGNRRGAWFYGSKIANACAGKSAAKMTVTFTRRRGSGSNAKRPLHLYLHGYTSPPSGQLSLGNGPEELLSLSVGASGTATLPAAWRSALASGSERGLAIYDTGSHDYMAVTGGSIRITFN